MEHLWEPLSDMLMFLGSFFCHQEPERSLFCAETPVAFCVRCLGMYSAFFWGVGMHLFFRRGTGIAKPVLAAGLALVVIGGLDPFWPRSGNLHRLLAGGVLGLGLAVVTLPLAGDFIRGGDHPPPARSGGYLLSLGLWLPLLWMVRLTALAGWRCAFLLSLWGAAGLVLMIGVLNAMIMGSFIPWRPSTRGMALLILGLAAGAEIAALLLWGSPRAG